MSHYDDSGDSADYLHCINDSSEEDCGLIDAFQQFEAQAEKRTLDLLTTTDEQLFDKSHPTIEKATKTPDYPAYMYMSDHFRLKKPPNFQHWQQNFQYLRVKGSNMLEESLDHIQLVPMERKESNKVLDDVNNVELQVKGTACFKIPTAPFRECYEEIILCDGVMEEQLQLDEKSKDEKPEHGGISLHATLVEEVLDFLTIKFFSSTVVPMLTLLSQTLVEKQDQNNQAVHDIRECTEGTMEKRLAFKQTQHLELEEEAEEDAEESSQQQLHGEEKCKRMRQFQTFIIQEKDGEVALAHSVQKETCGSRRDRQLMPGLRSKRTKEDSIDNFRKHHLTRTNSRRIKQFSTHCKPQSDKHTGRALTGDNVCDNFRMKKIAQTSVYTSGFPDLLYQGHRRKESSNRCKLPSIPRSHSKAI
ncbi:hypothetical protein Plhal304r1_c016g0058571 [Plasmopara halstedii]